MGCLYKIMHRVVNDSGYGGSSSSIFMTYDKDLCDRVYKKLIQCKGKRHDMYITTVEVDTEMTDEEFISRFKNIIREDILESIIEKPKLKPGISMIDESISLREELSTIVNKICGR